MITVSNVRCAILLFSELLILVQFGTFSVLYTYPYSTVSIFTKSQYMHKYSSAAHAPLKFLLFIIKIYSQALFIFKLKRFRIKISLTILKCIAIFPSFQFSYSNFIYQKTYYNMHLIYMFTRTLNYLSWLFFSFESTQSSFGMKVIHTCIEQLNVDN